ncbi:hypothetical protein X975_08643, partial [Stegodyphus mimosarum]
MHKICVILFFAVLVVAAEVAVAEEGPDESGIMRERCDPRMCGSDMKHCHHCCQHNYHIDFQAAGNDEELQHAAIDVMCECYHNVNGHQHHEDIPAL